VKFMKHATLSVAVVFLLASPLAVLAQTPAVPASPLEAGAAKAAVETAAQPVIEALPTAATAAGTAAVEVQPKPVDAAPAAPAAIAASAAKTAAPAVAETPAAAGMVELDVMPPETAAAAPAAGTTSAGDAIDPCPMHGMGKGRMGGDGSGMRGMKQGAGCKGNCKREGMGKKHAEVVQRLDMIEARMAKIEAMLESLMKRADD
jgi:hypothetical protein